MKFVFNPFTATFDIVDTGSSSTNFDEIVTAELNAAGNPRLIYDPVSRTFIQDGPTVVIDNNGNVVVV